MTNTITESLTRRIASLEQSNAMLQAKIDTMEPKGWDMSLAHKYIANNNASIARDRQRLEEVR
jgi:hypothetical protein